MYKYFPIIMGGAPSQVLLTVSPGEDEEKIKKYSTNNRYTQMDELNRARCYVNIGGNLFCSKDLLLGR